MSGHRICTVDAFGVRESSAEAEEFTLVGVRSEFPGVIPGGEVWVSRRHFPREGVFLIAHALALARGHRPRAVRGGGRRGRPGRRAADPRGPDRGGVPGRQAAPRRCPRRLYDRLYATIPDPEAPIKVWLIDGLLARCWYKTDYAEGGHYVVYPWVPRARSGWSGTRTRASWRSSWPTSTWNFG